MALTNWALNIKCNSIHVFYWSWGYFNFFFIKHIFKKLKSFESKTYKRLFFLFGMALPMFNAKFLPQIFSLFLQNQPKS